MYFPLYCARQYFTMTGAVRVMIPPSAQGASGGVGRSCEMFYFRKEEKMRKLLTGFPWGIAAGATGILAFYLTIAVYGIRFIFAQVNGQTGQVATLFDTWWQTLLFVLDILFLLLFAATLAAFIVRRVLIKKGSSQETQDGGSQGEKTVD